MLKTGIEQPSSVLQVGDRTMPIIFGDIEGTVIRLVVNTAKGNENSKANKEERNKVVLYWPPSISLFILNNNTKR